MGGAFVVIVALIVGAYVFTVFLAHRREMKKINSLKNSNIQEKQ